MDVGGPTPFLPMKLAAAFHKEEDENAPAARTIPTRAEIPADDTWNLTALYPDAAAWQAEFEAVRAQFPKLIEFKGKLGLAPEQLRDALEFEKALNLKIERLYHYAMLQVSEDGSNSEFLARQSQLMNLLTRIDEASAFFTPEVQAIDDAAFASFLSDAALASWKTKLEKLRRFKPHVLSEAEERLLALGYSPLAGHKETFSQLTNIDMRFGVIKDETGREVELSQSSFSSFLYKRDPQLRKTAFHQFYKEFSDHKFTLASAFSNSVKADVFRARARHYPSALEAALFSDRVPLVIYDSLIASVRARFEPLQEYYELRRRLLGLEEIHHYDTYVPLVSSVQTNTSFDQAIDLVIESLAPLGNEYVSTLDEGLRRGRWCDRYETKGKRSGAFSAGSYGNPPYIMMNYKPDVFSDVYTLAHEAGHSMHTWYAQRTQSYQDYDYPIFLAEVASTFNEALLTHHLLEKTDDPQMRAYLINRQVDDLRGTLYRQTMFAEFEKLVHAMEEAGEALTLDSFRSVYRGLLEAYFGPRFTLDEELDLECLRIPHFYNAFYVYKYATGLSAAVALSQKVLHGGAADVAAYTNFLKSGGVNYPLETLQASGVDLTSPDPVNATLDLFARRVKELEALLA
jgi:oligoendopeptidase F